MKHKLLKLNAVLFLGLEITPLQGQTTLNVTTINNTQTNYALSKIRKMTFPSTGNITVTRTTATIDNFSLLNLRYLKFTDIVSNIESTSDDSNGSSLCLYPNPVADVLNINLSASLIQTAIVEVLSIDGKILYKVLLTSKSCHHQINVSQLRQGIYICRVNNGTNVKTIKFIKQ